MLNKVMRINRNQYRCASYRQHILCYFQTFNLMAMMQNMGTISKPIQAFPIHTPCGHGYGICLQDTASYHLYSLGDNIPAIETLENQIGNTRENSLAK